MSALIAQSTQLAQPNAQDDGDALALRYGAEVSLRGARGLGLSVAPVREADDVVFEAAVGGLNLGAADERFVVCNAMVRDDKGPVRYGDVVGLRSRLARGRCLGVRDAAFAGEDEAPAFRRALVGAGERWEVLSAADAGSADEDMGAYLDQAVFDLELDGSATTPAHCSSETAAAGRWV